MVVHRMGRSRHTTVALCDSSGMTKATALADLSHPSAGMQTKPFFCSSGQDQRGNEKSVAVPV